MFAVIHDAHRRALMGLAGSIAFAASCAGPGYRSPVTLSAQCASAAADSSPIYNHRDVTTAAQPVRGTQFGPMFPSAPPIGQRYLVEVEFVVDTLGRPDMCSAHVVRESHPGLSVRVLNRVGGWRFTPALREGRKVRQLATFMFEAGNSPAGRSNESLTLSKRSSMAAAAPPQHYLTRLQLTSLR